MGRLLLSCSASAMVLMMAFAGMSIILMLGDIIVPIKTGL